MIFFLSFFALVFGEGEKSEKILVREIACWRLSFGYD
jgi:hypothetical protein